MKIIIPIITAILAGVLVFFYMSNQNKQTKVLYSSSEIDQTKMTVEKTFRELQQRISNQLRAFASTTGSDKDLALKLFVENDPTAAYVTEFAGKFMHPMNFEFLEVADSSFAIISSGQFPASVGTSIQEKCMRLSTEPSCIIDQIMGDTVIALEAKEVIKNPDLPYNFYAVGGIKIDQKLLDYLSPRKGVKVLLQQGDKITGIDNISSISDLKDNSILLNNKEYAATSLDLPSADPMITPRLLIILDFF